MEPATGLILVNPLLGRYRRSAHGPSACQVRAWRTGTLAKFCISFTGRAHPYWARPASSHDDKTECGGACERGARRRWRVRRTQGLIRHVHHAVQRPYPSHVAMVVWRSRWSVMSGWGAPELATAPPGLSRLAGRFRSASGWVSAGGRGIATGCALPAPCRRATGSPRARRPRRRRQ
jgi:hypothetical protein